MPGSFEPSDVGRAVLGSVVIYDNKSALAEFVPALKRLMRRRSFLAVISPQ